MAAEVVDAPHAGKVTEEAVVSSCTTAATPVAVAEAALTAAILVVEAEDFLAPLVAAALVTAVGIRTRPTAAIPVAPTVAVVAVALRLW